MIVLLVIVRVVEVGTTDGSAMTFNANPYRERMIFTSSQTESVDNIAIHRYSHSKPPLLLAGEGLEMSPKIVPSSAGLTLDHIISLVESHRLTPASTAATIADQAVICILCLLSITKASTELCFARALANTVRHHASA